MHARTLRALSRGAFNYRQAVLKFVVLGNPVGHSLSPRLHRAALDAAGIEGSYDARRVDAAGFGVALSELRNGALDGANVTMPHKVRAAESADVLSEAAARAKSVNTLWMRNGDLVGDSTDIPGIRRAWGPLPDGPALILGSGGAAAAALLALEGRPLRVAARREERARSVVAQTGVEATVAPWSTERWGGEVIVNATPIGMRGEALPAHFLSDAVGLFDMPYGREETPAVVSARRAGIPVVPGFEMLLHQAAVSFLQWTGVHPSIEAMREAVDPDHSPESNP